MKPDEKKKGNKEWKTIKNEEWWKERRKKKEKIIKEWNSI